MPSLPKSTILESADKFASEYMMQDSNLPTISGRTGLLKSTVLSPRGSSNRFKNNLKFPAANQITINSANTAKNATGRKKELNESANMINKIEKLNRTEMEKMKAKGGPGRKLN